MYFIKAPLVLGFVTQGRWHFANFDMARKKNLLFDKKICTRMPGLPDGLAFAHGAAIGADGRKPVTDREIVAALGLKPDDYERRIRPIGRAWKVRTF